MSNDDGQIERDRQRQADELTHGRITKQAIGAFFEVYNELGGGFPESVYQEALRLSLRQRGLLAEREVAIRVRFRGLVVGSFRADLLVERVVLVELKVAMAIDHSSLAQLMNYLRATRIEVGLLLNFGPKAAFKRVSFENSNKKYRP
jgi:GxxExxY protein